jgi:FAD/FMN-containing dehydrogenase
MATAHAIPRYADQLSQTAHDNLFKTLLEPNVKPVLPPGLSQAEFDNALKELGDAIGEGALFTGSRIKEYVDPYEIPEGGHGQRVPCAAACPSSVEELQAVLKVARKYKIPVWTFSRGKNLG